MKCIAGSNECFSFMVLQLCELCVPGCVLLGAYHPLRQSLKIFKYPSIDDVHESKMGP